MFKLGTNGSGFTVLKTYSTTTSGLNTDGANPYGGLVLSGTTLFGTAEEGGIWRWHSVPPGHQWLRIQGVEEFFRRRLQRRRRLDKCGRAYPDGTLVLAGNFLFGTAFVGGASGNGAVFTVSTTTVAPSSPIFIVSARATMARIPSRADVVRPHAVRNRQRRRQLGGRHLFSLNTNATGFTNFYIFDGTDGIEPMGAWCCRRTLYGEGVHCRRRLKNGMVYKVNTNGTGLRRSTNFPATDPDTGTNIGGANPQGNLALSRGPLFGTTTGAAQTATGRSSAWHQRQRFPCAVGFSGRLHRFFRLAHQFSRIPDQCGRDGSGGGAGLVRRRAVRNDL